MKIWKRLISGLLALTLLASMGCAALAAQPKTEKVPKPSIKQLKNGKRQRVYYGVVQLRMP